MRVNCVKNFFEIFKKGCGKEGLDVENKTVLDCTYEEGD